MNRANMSGSGLAVGWMIMKKCVVAFAVMLATACSFTLPAHGASGAGLGLLAANSGASSGLDHSGSALLDASDAGGGSDDTRVLGGAQNHLSPSKHDSMATALPDGLADKTSRHSNSHSTAGDSASRSATFRWQSLVPGAIK